MKQPIYPKRYPPPRNAPLGMLLSAKVPSPNDPTLIERCCVHAVSACSMLSHTEIIRLTGTLLSCERMFIHLCFCCCNRFPVQWIVLYASKPDIHLFLPLVLFNQALVSVHYNYIPGDHMCTFVLCSTLDHNPYSEVSPHAEGRNSHHCFYTCSPTCSPHAAVSLQIDQLV